MLNTRAPIQLEVKLKELAEPILVGPGHTTTVDVPNYTGAMVPLEIGLWIVPRTDVYGHLQPYVKNMGELGFGNFGQKDMAVHVEEIALVIKLDPGMAMLPFRRNFGRDDLRNFQFDASTLVGNVLIGIRDGSFREPTAIEVTEDHHLKLILLDRRPPKSGYPGYYRLYSTELQDPDSIHYHRIPGGRMYMWDCLGVDANKPHLLSHDPMPDTLPREWYEMAKVLPSGSNTRRNPRHQAVLNSLTSMHTNASGEWYEDATNSSMLKWMVQSWARFHTWNHVHQVLNIPDTALNTQWNNWPDFMWAEGHYNLGYLWTTTMLRHMLASTDPGVKQMSWYIFQRFARWECTSALCWTKPGLGGTLGNRRGWHLYEKSIGQAVTEVGSNYWPSSYKQYSENILCSAMVYQGHPWAEQAKEAHLEPLRADQFGYKTHIGDWGIRAMGWGMMNNVAAFRYTRDEQFKQNALDTAANWIRLCKDPARRASAAADFGAEDPYWDNELGLPYVVNRAGTPKNSVQAFEYAKVLNGVIETWQTCDGVEGTQLRRKIDQMNHWVLDELLIDHGDIVAFQSGFYPHRIKCRYGFQGRDGINLFTKAAAHLSLFVGPIGFAAINGDERAKRLYPRLMKDAYEQIDWNTNPYGYSYWQGSGALIDAGNNLAHVVTGTSDFNGVQVGRHTVYLEHVDSQTFDVAELVAIEGNALVVNATHLSRVMPLINTGAFNWHIAGPDRGLVINRDCKAVRSINAIPVMNRPNVHAKFTWWSGFHFNTWQKDVIFMLHYYDQPYYTMDILAAQK